MPEFTIDFILQAIGGRARGTLPVKVTGLSTDTRKLTPGALFVALKGESFDGHDFVAEALKSGAVAALVSREIVNAGPQIIVENTLLALGALAAAYRATLTPKVIAVTGSTGKTSVKEMIAAILSQGWRTYRTPGNFNNEIGVPLALLELDEQVQAVVIELAMRGKGQIAYLAEMVAPQIGVITNIGQSHLELLGTQEAIARAKGELLEALPADGTAVLHAEDEFFEPLRGLTPCQVVSFGTNDEADVRVSEIEVNSEGATDFLLTGWWGEERISLPVGGRHHALNAAAAAGAAVAVGADPAWIKPGLAAFQGAEMRTRVLTAPGGFTVLDDTYNASPDSMRAALELLADLPGIRKWAALGDMKELGSRSAEWHRELGQLAADLRLTGLVTVGELAAHIAAGAREGKVGMTVFEETDNEKAAEWLLEQVKPGDVVLVKGSRAMKMEEIVQRLLARGEDA